MSLWGLLAAGKANWVCPSVPVLMSSHKPCNFSRSLFINWALMSSTKCLGDRMGDRKAMKVSRIKYRIKKDV